MSYTADIAILLGEPDQVLTAQLYNYDGTLIGSPISTGFTAIGNGFYHWHYEDVPNNFRGGVRFYTAADALVAIAVLNPEEFEFRDIPANQLIYRAASILSMLRTSDENKQLVFLQELADKRGKPNPGFNPIWFMERRGAKIVIPTAFEPDPATHRDEYYYNAIHNTLYKRVVTNNTNGKRTAIWQKASA